MITTDGTNVPGSALGPQMDWVAALTKMPAGGGTFAGQDSTSVAASVTSQQKAQPKTLTYVLVGLILLLILSKIGFERSKKLEMHHVRISVLNWIVVSFLALTGILSAKVIANKYFPNGSLTQVISSV